MSISVPTFLKVSLLQHSSKYLCYNIPQSIYVTTFFKVSLFQNSSKYLCSNIPQSIFVLTFLNYLSSNIPLSFYFPSFLTVSLFQHSSFSVHCRTFLKTISMFHANILHKLGIMFAMATVRNWSPPPLIPPAPPKPPKLLLIYLKCWLCVVLINAPFSAVSAHH